MKTKNLFLTALAAIALVSCADSEFVGEDSAANDVAAYGDGSINFGFDMSPVTRGDLVGADAATKLQSQFVVYGTKHTAAEIGAATNDAVVFQNYKVEYTAGTAGTKASNTHNWDYVGLTPYTSPAVSPVTTGEQAIKYWDYSATDGYTFYAFATKGDLENNKVLVTKTTSGSTVYDKGYSIVTKKGSVLDNLYIADRKPVAKVDYKKPVTLTFRNFASRVRVGFYETIPGYKVRITKFYIDDAATSPVITFGAMDDAQTDYFYASLQNIKFPTATKNNTLTVTYYDNTNIAVENHVKVTPNDVDYDYSLQLGAGVLNKDLATSSATPTWDKTDGAYTTVYPFISTTPMLVKIDYTLIPNDGTSNIEVKGANVVVPTEYVKWESNFAYTYLFKISDNTNGYTGDPTDPAGLFPITFDAVVVDYDDTKTQETITTIADYSITTYSNGSKVTVDNEYKKGKDIYVVKTDDATHNVVTHTAIGAAASYADVYKAETDGDAINEATVLASLNGSPNGIKLTAVDPAATLEQYVPKADGTHFNFGYKGAVKFTPATAGTYVYVSRRQNYVAATYASASADYDPGTTYYFKNTVTYGLVDYDYYYAAEGINAGNYETNKANLYTQTVPATTGLYDIKVIKVVN